jgi:hypothetical protein
MGITVNSNMTFVETLKPELSYSYRVVGGPLDAGTYVEYAVELTGTGAGGAPGAGQPTTMTATIPVPQATKYVELAAQVPTPAWATVTGYLAFDGVDQGGSANTYGVDLIFEPAVISPDWDVMSFGG